MPSVLFRLLSFILDKIIAKIQNMKKQGDTFTRLLKRYCKTRLLRENPQQPLITYFLKI